MPGRTDNCVKNHFYSKLRKAMRKLNKYIHDFYRREFKEIKINAIYKIVEANEEHPLISGHQSLAPASGAGVCLSTCLASTSFWTSLVPS